MKPTHSAVSTPLIGLIPLLLLSGVAAQQGPDVGPPCVERAIEEFDQHGPCNSNDVACYCEMPNQSKLASDMNAACVAASDTPAVQSISAYVQSFCHIVQGTGGEETSSGASSSTPTIVHSTSTVTSMPGEVHPSSGAMTSPTASVTSSVVTTTAVVTPITSKPASSTMASNGSTPASPANGTSAMPTSATGSVTPKSGGERTIHSASIAISLLVGIGGSMLLGWGL